MSKIDFIGWIGMILLLFAYALNAFSLIESDIIYHLLNIIGAITIVFSSFRKKDFQPVILNFIWAIVGFLSIVLAYL